MPAAGRLGALLHPQCHLAGQPYVPSFKVSKYDAPTVGKFKCPARLLGDVDCPLKGKPVLGGMLYQSLHIPPPISSVTM